MDRIKDSCLESKLNGEIRRIVSTIAYRLLGLGNKYKIIIVLNSLFV